MLPGKYGDRRKNFSLQSQDLKNIYSGKRVLITGHTGFKGSWLGLWLHSLSAVVAGYSLDPPTTPSMFQITQLADVIEDYRGDVRDYNLLKDVLNEFKPEIVFHLAAQPLVLQSYVEPRETFEVNVAGTVNVLDALRYTSSVKAIIVVTSDKCYENTESLYPYRETDALGGGDPYSASKAAAEIVCQSYRRSFFKKTGIGLASARSGNVFGGGDWADNRLIPDAMRGINLREPVTLRNPNSIRPWQHVLEPTYGYLLLGRYLSDQSIDYEHFAEAWNFGPNKESCLTTRELLDEFFDAYGEGSWQEDVSTGQATVSEATLLRLANDKAFQCLGWSPRWNMKKAVEKTVEWYKSFAAGDNMRQATLSNIKEYTEEFL